MSATLTPIPAAPAKTYAQHDDPFLFHRFRTWWLLLALFLMAQENGLFTRQDDTYWVMKGNSHLESSPVLLLLTVALWLICLGLMVTHVRPILRTMAKQKAVLAFSILALVSVSWSADPRLTLRRAVLLSLVSSFAWFFATCYSMGDQRRLLLATGVIVGLASLAMALLLPQYGIASTGEWKGVFGHKNHLGLGMFFIFSSLPFCRIANGRELLKLSLQALLPVGLILLSQSKTSLILALVLIAVRIIGPLIVRGRREQLPFMFYSLAFGLLIAALAATAGREMILSALGRDPSLTGRTEHWAVLSTFVLRHLWLGYGYQAFWTNHGDSLTAMRSIGAGMSGSDSGYVDTLLEFGVVGIVMMLILLLVSARDFLKLLRKPGVPLLAFWYVGVILAVYVGSISEGFFPVALGISTFVFVVACAGLKNLGNAPVYSASRSGL